MSSGLSEFLQVLPTQLIFMLCGSALLLAAALYFIVRARASGSKLTLNSLRVGNQFGSDRSSGGDYGSSYDDDAYPDMDMLTQVSANPSASYDEEPIPMPKPQPRRAATYNLSLPDGRNVEAAEVLTVARDLADGSLIIQIGSAAYTDVNQITDPEARRRLVNTVKQLAVFVTATSTESAKPAAPAAAPVPEPAPNGTVAPDEDDALPPLDDLVEEPQSAMPAYMPPPPRADGQMPGDLPKFEMPEISIDPRKKGKKEEIPEINIAGAIESYLQHKKSYTPEFAQRSIHVRPAYGGGVKIEVDGMFFDAVDEVDDSAVRAFLSETIEEWQSRQ